MLSPVSRIPAVSAAIVYTILGVLLLSFTIALAPVFAWKVSPFVAMAIGTWTLGAAIFCWASLITCRWSLVFSSLL